MTTNAQAALQAAATFLSHDSGANVGHVEKAADVFKEWLDGHDHEEREARRKQPVPKGAGNTDGVAEARAHGFPVRETRAVFTTEEPSLPPAGPGMRDTAGLPSAHVLDAPF